MAGDLQIHEEVIVHTVDAPAAAASAEVVTRLSGGVTHEYGPRVVIAAIPPGAAEAVQERVQGVEVVHTPAAISDETGRGLDEVGALGLEAHALRLSPEYAAAKADRPLAGKAWDSAEPPDPPDDHDLEAPPVGAAAATSARLTGKVAVGLIIVEGPTAALKFSADERTKVVAEVQNGLTWLGSQSSPAGISWSYDIRTVTLRVRPNAADTTSEQREARWRDPAMQQLGHGAGMAGVRAFVEDLRTRLDTDWAYCAFFTKYPLGHFAYASIGGPRLVMHFDNDGWGPDNIDRVFAHETGHVFRAPDEYTASNCNCGGQWGHFGVPNRNCATCAPDGGVACIMRSNDWAMCPYTPYHLGFPQTERFSGAFLPGTEAHGLWAGADWQHFKDKWQEWSNQGLRLVDLEVTEAGGQARYSGVFRQGTGAYALWVNSGWPQFRAKWEELSNQGLRLVDIEVAHIGGQARYSGVFATGTGAYALWANANWPSFQAKWQELTGQGLRLVDLDVTQVGGQTRYAGVFRDGTGPHGMWANADWPGFRNKWQEWSGQGLRLTDLEVTQSGGQTRYSGVFTPGTGEHALWTDADWPSFRAKWEELSGQGLRLAGLAIRPTAVQVPASDVPGLLADESSDGAGSGFSALGGVTLSGAAGDSTTGAGFGDLWLADTVDAPAGGTSAEGFGEAVLDSDIGDERSAEGFGGVVLTPSLEGAGGDESGSGFGGVGRG
jgi:hypothetical protein